MNSIEERLDEKIKPLIEDFEVAYMSRSLNGDCRRIYSMENDKIKSGDMILVFTAKKTKSNFEKTEELDSCDFSLKKDALGEKGMMDSIYAKMNSPKRSLEISLKNKTIKRKLSFLSEKDKDAYINTKSPEKDLGYKIGAEVIIINDSEENNRWTALYDDSIKIISKNRKYENSDKDDWDISFERLPLESSTEENYLAQFESYMKKEGISAIYLNKLLENNYNLLPGHRISYYTDSVPLEVVKIKFENINALNKDLIDELKKVSEINLSHIPNPNNFGKTTIHDFKRIGLMPDNY